ncbi:MAG: alpha-ribazole phosphatase [Acetivibrionales bacterium]|jgi:alpha-ribazole phosphatase
MELILVRHGVTELNNAGCFLGRTDCGLTPNGFQQAHRIKYLLQDTNFDCVYVSPLKRTMQTADILDREYLADNRLLEMNFGIFDGLAYSEIEKLYPEHLEAWNRDYRKYKIPDGESLDDVFGRVESFIKENVKTYKRVLAVTHGGVIRCALSLALLSREHFYRFQVDHGSLSYLEFNEYYSYIKAVNKNSMVKPECKKFLY